MYTCSTCVRSVNQGIYIHPLPRALYVLVLRQLLSPDLREHDARAVVQRVGGRAVVGQGRLLGQTLQLELLWCIFVLFGVVRQYYIHNIFGVWGMCFSTSASLRQHTRACALKQKRKNKTHRGQHPRRDDVDDARRRVGLEHGEKPLGEPVEAQEVRGLCRFLVGWVDGRFI